MSEITSLPERDEEHERLLAILFSLSPAQAGVVSCLTRGVTATTSQLQAYVGDKTPIKVAVSRARARMLDHEIDIMSRIHVGYWIEPVHQDKIKRMVDERFSA